MIGRSISHYEITEKLGEGGMGVVYKARDSHLKRFVALKVLPPDKIADPERKQRFIQEARSASALNHPSIITVHDIDQADGIDFIAMECIEGKTLDELIGRKGLKLNEALKYAVQIADALAAAHSAGIVHRDLKPGNVMVTAEGRVKVLDFGLAKLTERLSASDEDSTGTEQPATETGLILGTVSYMSPEQAEGKKVDARSDIFSFGSVLYEMLTGRKPFRRDTPALTLVAVLHMEHPPLSAEVPGDLSRLITRCLRKDPARRFQTMADLKVALEELKEDSDSDRFTLLRAPARSRKLGFLWLTLTVAVVLGLAAGGVLLWRRMQTTPVTDKDVLVLAEFTNTTGDTVFDGTLREALAVQLEQSPFLKILSDEEMRQDLRLMGRPVGERITNETAREICLREGEKVMIGGVVASLGKTYAITLQATNCQTGEALAREQVEATDKEHVLRAVATAATGMRAKLGESLPSIQKVGVPPEDVTTTSLEAFRAYALGRAQLITQSSLAALTFFQRATELDPNFALAYRWLGNMYWNIGEVGRGAECLKKAFALIDRVSERERLEITARYYMVGTGELHKAADTYQLLARTYPRDPFLPTALGIVYKGTSDWEKALPEFQKALAAAPRFPFAYFQLTDTYTCLGRYAEAKAVANKALTQAFDQTFTHVQLLRIAYIQGDSEEIETQIRQAAGGQISPDSLAVQAANAAALGQLRKGQEFLRRAREMQERRGFHEVAAHFLGLEALQDALAGNCETARVKARAAVLPDQAPPPPHFLQTTPPALSLALCGDVAAAQRAVDGIARRYPVNTIWNAVQLPSISAAIELSRGQPEKAIELLRSATPYERAYPYAGYIRGLAYSRARKAVQAAAEFQKLLDHRGANWGPYYPLSYIGLARAAALAGDLGRARKAYQGFFALWEDADPDIPVLREARQEYAKLE